MADSTAAMDWRQQFQAGCIQILNRIERRGAHHLCVELLGSSRLQPGCSTVASQRSRAFLVPTISAVQISTEQTQKRDRTRLGLETAGSHGGHNSQRRADQVLLVLAFLPRPKRILHSGQRSGPSKGTQKAIEIRHPRGLPAASSGLMPL